MNAEAKPVNAFRLYFEFTEKYLVRLALNDGFIGSLYKGIGRRARAGEYLTFCSKIWNELTTRNY
jgi:hypothetical protein